MHVTKSYWATVSQNLWMFLNLPLLFSASHNPRDETAIKVGAKKHIANIFRTREVVTLEKELNQSVNHNNC